jgi:4-hydroxybenzoate polyprenyltransferase
MLQLLRWKDWGYSKIPPFFTAGFLFLLTNKLPAAQSLFRFGAWLLFCAAFLAFGYGVNDFADRDADRRAGKPNAMLGLGTASAVAWLLALIALSIVGLIPYLADWRLVTTVACSYAAGFAYSVPPFRLKERGVAGLVSCAVAQRSLPVLVGAALFGRFDRHLWLYCALFTLVGLRWILLHQVIDAHHDETSGVQTFVTATGAGRSLFLMKKVVFPLELAALSAWLISISLAFPALWLLAPVYVLILRFLGYLWQRRWPPSNWTKYWLHPLSGFYEVLCPFFIGILTSVRNPVALPFLVLLAIWLAPREAPRLALLRHLLMERFGHGKVLDTETSSGA